MTSDANVSARLEVLSLLLDGCRTPTAIAEARGTTRTAATKMLSFLCDLGLAERRGRLRDGTPGRGRVGYDPVQPEARLYLETEGGAARLARRLAETRAELKQLRCKLRGQRQARPMPQTVMTEVREYGGALRAAVTALRERAASRRRRLERHGAREDEKMADRLQELLEQVGEAA